MKYSRNAPRDPLNEIELKIAKRADQLAASSSLRTGLNLHCWTEAEREIFGTLLAPPAPFVDPIAESVAAEPQLATAS